MKKRRIIIAIVVVVAAIAIFPLAFGKKKESYTIRTYQAREGELELTVTASGNIQPVTKVDVGTQVSGIVKKIYVDYNSQVTAGQLLAELDKSTLLERVRQSKATLDNAESNEKLALQNYNRTQSLYEQNAATPVQMEEAENKLTTAKGNVVTSNADYQQSMVNLSYADIYSPISGQVLNRAVDEGQTVAASFSTPTLFTIAMDLTKMQVEVDVDEADIGRIKVGQKAEFIVDTYPGETFSGVVSLIRLEPVVTSNVVTYTVIVEAPNQEEKLLPGMTANITITTQSPHGIIIPAEALYFSPDATKLKEYTIDDDVKAGNKLWIKTANGMKSTAITAGASDGVETIILSGIGTGDNIVVGVDKVATKSKAESASIFPKPPERKGGGGGPGGPGGM